MVSRPISSNAQYLLLPRLYVQLWAFGYPVMMDLRHAFAPIVTLQNQRVNHTTVIISSLYLTRLAGNGQKRYRDKAVSCAVVVCAAVARIVVNVL
jgi:hypothetical protein